MSVLAGYLLYATPLAIPATWWSVNKTREVVHNYLNKRGRKALAEQDIPYTGIEPQTWCAGCDSVVPVSTMRFVDEDGDGIPDGLYRCGKCRGILGSDEKRCDAAYRGATAPKEIPWFNVDDLTYRQYYAAVNGYRARGVECDILSNGEYEKRIERMKNDRERRLGLIAKYGIDQPLRRTS